MYERFSQRYFLIAQKGFTLAAFIYESLSALKPIQKLVSEAGAAIDDTRTLFKSDIPEVLGAAGGIGAGAAAGAAAAAACGCAPGLIQHA